MSRSSPETAALQALSERLPMALTAAEGILSALLPEWQLLLQGWAADGSLVAAAQEALMLQGEPPQALKDLATQWASADYSGIPPIVLLSSEEMNGAMGAYAASTGTIYLNADWLATASRDQINAVLTEELGHSLDATLNVIDTPGDEGEYFARLLSELLFPDPEKQRIRVQSDSGQVVVRNTVQSVEFAASPSIRGNSLYLLVDGPYWEQAELAAESLGGFLVSIGSSEENQWLVDTFSSIAQSSAVWIGLSDKDIEGTWSWSSGEQVSFTNWGLLEPYAPVAYRDDLVEMWIRQYNGDNAWTTPGKWNDTSNILPDGVANNQGIAEVPLQLEIELPRMLQEGRGVFTTTIRLNADSPSGENLAEGSVVYWEISNITPDDLSYGTIIGSGVIANGQLIISHALADDLDTEEQFSVSVFSDSARTHRIGDTASAGVREATPIVRGSSVYTLVKGPTWTEAEGIAVSMGGHLVTINNQSEQEFLFSSYQNTNARDFNTLWLGLTKETGEWKWVSGQDYSYTNWENNFTGGTNPINAVLFSQWDGRWDDHDGNEPWWNDPRGIAEVQISTSAALSAPPKEGGGAFTMDIDVSAGTTSAKHSLVQGAKIWYSVSGIDAADLDFGSLNGWGTIDSSGNIMVSGATTPGMTFALKDDGIAETESLNISFYTDDPLTTTETLANIQLGATQTAFIVDTGVPFSVGKLITDDPTVYVTGTKGITGSSKIESFTLVKTTSGTGKNRVVTNTPTYTTLATYNNPGVDGIAFSGGASSNTISAAGVAGDPLRPAFNGQAVLDGQLGIDTITGGSYRNWLIGGGIYSSPLSTTTTAVDTLIGTVGATDVFDLRTSTFTADAYSASNSGSARMNNYTKGEDWIVLSGSQYSFTPVTTTTGTKRNKVTTTTGYQIFSGSELVATVTAAPGTSFTGTAANDLSILYGQTDTPTNTLFNGQQLFFG